MVEIVVPTFPDTVAVIKASNGSIIYLVGTAHFSKESQDDVAQVITIFVYNIYFTNLYSYNF